MPRGFRAADGPRPEFAALYGLREHASPHYPPRTALNVKEADATLRFATDWDSPGERLTLAFCARYGRPHFDVTPGSATTPADAVAWLAANNVRVLNVAGNTARASPGIAAFMAAFLGELFDLLAAWDEPRA